VIAAEGEQKSSKALKEAADIIAQSPAALQLRYLQVGVLLFWRIRHLKFISLLIISYLL
jgi:hypothetical protein